jgi:hypothetical protein
VREGHSLSVLSRVVIGRRGWLLPSHVTFAVSGFCQRAKLRIIIEALILKLETAVQISRFAISEEALEFFFLEAVKPVKSIVYFARFENVCELRCLKLRKCRKISRISRQGGS